MEKIRETPERDNTGKNIKMGSELAKKSKLKTFAYVVFQPIAFEQCFLNGEAKYCQIWSQLSFLSKRNPTTYEPYPAVETTPATKQIATFSLST